MKPQLRSLSARLTIAVTAVVGLALAVSSTLVYAAVSSALWREFDDRLAEEARTVATMVEDSEGTYDFDYDAMGQLEAAQGGLWYEVWLENGTAFARAGALGETHLPRNVSSGSTRLPGGERARVLTARLLPRQDEEVPADTAVKHVFVAVALPTGQIEAALAAIRLRLAGLTIAVLALAAVAGLFAIRSGLKPIERLTARIDAMNARRLGDRLPVDDVPTELERAVIELNLMLGRLEEAFGRERRFNADVSHELRTPLAGLRSILEVSLSRKRTAEEYAATLREMEPIVIQMSGIAENLLMLSRLDSNQVEVLRERVLLHELVEESFSGYAAKAAARGLQLRNEVPAGTAIFTDRHKLRIVLTNLLSNAVEYTAAAGWIRIRTDLARGVLVEVSDSGPPIPAAALPQIFDRFFRADASRAGAGEHVGIGLALARALCEVLHLSLAGENAADGTVAFHVSTTAGSDLQPGA